VINYIFGLAVFRLSEDQKDRPGCMEYLKRSLVYINQALALDPDFPEARWMHSQILAIQGGQIAALQQDFKSLRENEGRFSPALYLYDLPMIERIKKGISVNSPG